ncbi:hypothetical protein [Roseicella aerolata]|uniref:Uncharacterized protein n=1 Tax=Roseicella aerolata TaxID=2883479 RepID=A0A9X1IC77_9PROT|nr:hypothetical protein [Roseicella aerolata]MCB4821249.1 hypothetical protein [Roseicella aerolata]
MRQLSLIARLEQQLGGILRRWARESPNHRRCLIEAVDEAAVWEDPDSVIPMAARGLPLITLAEQYPLFTCGAASEVGHRYEGVGTVFWARLELLLGAPVAPSERGALAAAYDELANRYPIVRPIESGFATQFSIIAWPIANALMPAELAGSIARLLARSPASSLPTTGGSRNLEGLRSWAASYEGMRLTDWLSDEQTARRVLMALLTNNAASEINDATFSRLKDAYRAQADALLTLRSAQQRAKSLSRRPDATPSDPGQLTLKRSGAKFALFVSWSPLPSELLDVMRRTARAKGWRPRLWGGGPPVPPDHALGTLPIPIGMNSPPSGAAYGDTDAVFGPDTPAARALAARTVDWSLPILFLESGDDAAQRATAPLSQQEGKLWIATAPADPGWAGFPIEGEVCGLVIRSADLSSSATREALTAKGVLQVRGQLSPSRRCVRSPVDAIAKPRRVATVGRALFIAAADAGSGEVIRLNRRGGSAATTAASLGVRIVEPFSVGEALPAVQIFERDSLFDAILQQRLHLRLESRFGIGEWPLEITLLSAGKILAHARERVTTGSQLSSSGAILKSLYRSDVLETLVDNGRGELRLRIGHAYRESIPLAARRGEVDWGPDPSAAFARSIPGIVRAEAPRPHRFTNVQAVDEPTHGATLLAVREGENGYAVPGLIVATDRMNLNDLAADLSDLSGLRRLRGAGAGLRTLVEARRAWSTAVCPSLAAHAVRARVVKQFEEPLVLALCGRGWADAEAREREVPRDPGKALFLAARHLRLFELPEAFTPGDVSRFGYAFVRLLQSESPSWPCNPVDFDPALADQALADAYSETLSLANTEGRLPEVGADDHDFGSPEEDWHRACELALSAVFRTGLLELIVPQAGVEALRGHPYQGAELADCAELLAAWSATHCLPRGHLTLDAAMAALQFWMAQEDRGIHSDALRAMAHDPFVARAVRYAALRWRDSNEF